MEMIIYMKPTLLSMKILLDFDPSPTALELTWAPSFCLEGGSLLRRLPRSSGSWAHVSHPNVGVNPPPEVVSVINEIMSTRCPVLCFADNIS